MEKYVIKTYHPITFEPSDVQTNLPKELVEKTENFLKSLEGSNWYVTPVMVNPSTLSVMIGVIERKETGFGSKFTVTISENY